MQFRYDINGLRAIAILGVLIFHFHHNWLTGGFAGVDVFFVISGYLMTSIIFNQLQNNTFSYRAFYYARAKRIIPPLAVLCIVLLVYGWFNLFPSDYRTLAKHISTSLVFISNFIFSNENGYFTAAVQEKWLLHTWSLSVEWQFYILYPLLLSLLKRKMSSDGIRIILLIITLLGIALSCYGSFYLQQKSYFYLPTRAWELLAGGLVFLYPVKTNTKIAKLIEIIGLILIFLGYIFFTSKLIWPSLYTVLPVLGSCLLLSVNQKNSSFTNNWLFQKIGKASYSIYLWHWPICVYLYLNGFSDSLVATVLGIISAFFVGFSSYYLIERNNIYRFTKLNLSKPLMLWLIALILSIIVYQTHGIKSHLREKSVSAQAQFIENYKHEKLGNAYLDECNAYSLLKSTGHVKLASFCNHSVSRKTGGIFLWGDSHAQALSLGIRKNLNKETPFYQVASSGCKPSLFENGLKSTLDQACDISNKIAIKSIESLKPDLVIIAQVNQHEKTNWNEITQYLKKIGVKHILLVGPDPQWRPSLPYVITQRHWNEENQYIKDRGLDKSIIQTNNMMKDEIKNYEYISLIDSLCDKNYSCLTRLKTGKLMVFDYGHLTPEGSNYVVKTYIMPKIKAVLAS